MLVVLWMIRVSRMDLQLVEWQQKQVGDAAVFRRHFAIDTDHHGAKPNIGESMTTHLLLLPPPSLRQIKC